MERKMSDPSYNAVPPGGYWDELDDAPKDESWADFVVDMAIEEAMLRRKEGEKKC
jgi:hypothetical protein